MNKILGIVSITLSFIPSLISKIHTWNGNTHKSTNNLQIHNTQHTNLYRGWYMHTSVTVITF